MKLERVTLDDVTRIEHEFFLETTGKNRFWYTLVAKFRGRYRDGSEGAPDAHFMCGLTEIALEIWRPAALVLDLSELQYDWGDEMDLVLSVGQRQHVPSAVVIGPGCSRAIATLFWGTDTSRLATEAENIFTDLDAAWKHVRKTG